MYNGTLDCWRKIAAQEGTGAFFKVRTLSALMLKQAASIPARVLAHNA
jgi:hypothetical protein